MEEKIQKNKVDNVELSASNVITSINGVDINEMNKNGQNEDKKVKSHTEEEDMLNYNILFMLLGLGCGMVFGKLLTPNIAIAMCSGTLIGLVTGIIYTEYLIRKNKSKRENGERKD